MNADGSGKTRLTSSWAYEGQPDWSPDGARIAFTSDRDGDDDIYVMNADGSNAVNISNNTLSDNWPAWSPDDKRIAFSSYRDSQNDMYVMKADGSSLSRLTSARGGDTNPAWSPDGRKICFASDRSDPSHHAWQVFLMDANGNDETTIPNAPGDEQADPAWCPVPSVVRTLIGPPGSDHGANPPFGAARPLVVVGVNADGLASAAALYLLEANWGTVKVSALNNICADLAGLKVTGTDLRRIDEDMGQGIPRRQWTLTGAPAAGAALVFFSGDSGKVASIIVSADTTLTTSARAMTTQAAGGQLVLQGSFTQAYSAPDPQRNLVMGVATRVALDSRTGEVVSVQ